MRKIVIGVAVDKHYGYMEGIIASDGEEQDAYILWGNEPVKEFVGRK